MGCDFVLTRIEEGEEGAIFISQCAGSSAASMQIPAVFCVRRPAPNASSGFSQLGLDPSLFVYDFGFKLAVFI